jgi:thioredoxin-like negative regulator of GroEL
MSLHDVHESEYLIDLPSIRGAEAVLFYTPLCGTCKLAERMLEIVQATTSSVHISKLNINYAPQLRERWQITSVPCLVLLKNGQPLKYEYAMKSVDYLYQMIKELE